MKSLDQNIRNKFQFLTQLLPGMETSTRLGPLIIDSSLPCDMFNIVCCCGGEKREQVGHALQHFHSKSLPFAWWVGFDDEPDWIQEELRSHGLRPSESELAMVCQLKGHSFSLPDSVVVKPASSEAAINDLLSVMLEIIPEEEKEAVRSYFTRATPFLTKSDSPLRFFIAYQDRQPAAICSVFLSDGIASIFDVIVRPERRGRGLGKLMTQVGMDAAQAADYETCGLTATNDAKYLYDKIGFTALKEMWVYTNSSCSPQP